MAHRTAARTLIALTVLVAAGSTMPMLASGQSVSDVVERMKDAARRQAEGIDDYTVVHRVMGFESEIYMEKEVHGDVPVFVPRQSAAQGMGSMPTDFGYGDLAAFADALVEHGRYAGTQDVRGRSAHVIAIDDLSQMAEFGPQSPGDMEFTPRSGAIYVDSDLWMPVRMEFEGEATDERGTHDITAVIDQLDYRSVDGLMIAHRTTMKIEGLGAMIDPETQAQIDEMRKQLESVPESQRAMIEAMLGPQIEQIERMTEGDGAMTVEVEVSEVRVNTGPPGR